MCHAFCWTCVASGAHGPVVGSEGPKGKARPQWTTSPSMPTSFHVGPNGLPRNWDGGTIFQRQHWARWAQLRRSVAECNGRRMDGPRHGEAKDGKKGSNKNVRRDARYAVLKTPRTTVRRGDHFASNQRHVSCGFATQHGSPRCGRGIKPHKEQNASNFCESNASDSGSARHSQGRCSLAAQHIFYIKPSHAHPRPPPRRHAGAGVGWFRDGKGVVIQV